MSASPPEVPNDHKNDSETNSRREKKVRKKKRRSPSTFSSSNSSVLGSNEARKRKTGKSDQKEKAEVLLLKANLKGLICQQNASELLMRRSSLNENLTNLH